MHLQQVAAQLATYYGKNDKVEAVILGGSVAKGWEDSYSDIELLVLWTEAPADEDRKKPIQAVDGKILSFEAFEEEEWSEAYVTEGIKLEISSFLTSTITDWLKDVVDDFDDDVNKQMIASLLVTGKSLYGGDVFEYLHKKAIAYPGQLGNNMVANHINLGNSWSNREALLFRGDWFMLRAVMQSVQSKVLAQLFGLNRVYLQHPLYKWQKKCVETMYIKPERFTERMEKVILSHPAEGLPILETLVKDLIKLITIHEPSIQIDQKRIDYLRPKQRSVMLVQLDKGDADALFAFEVENRSYFEKMVPGRGDDYYNFPIFLKRLDVLLKEQEKQAGAYYLIKDETGIVGRINLVISNESADLGYRVGERFTGNGVAKQALSLAISEARTIPGLRKLVAKTTTANIGSQKVLECNGFVRMAVEEKPFEWKGQMQQFVHFERSLTDRSRSSVVLTKKSKVALIKRELRNETYYVFPGGGVEEGESLEEAARREAFEELGVHVNLNKCIATIDFNGKQYFFSATIQAGIFGTGQGEEFVYSDRNKGTYEPVWLEIDQLRDIDVRPKEIVEVISKRLKE
ncbi:GNAT family N-acetyltransferase [Shouchella patagoniensis]|uniref:GNAT family N-acetyltransferase n=1 Tax=Shouchella patagoniensis TaxID=228576 RepID=UPI000994E3F1